MTLDQESKAKYMLEFLDNKDKILFATAKVACKTDIVTWRVNKSMQVIIYYENKSELISMQFIL